MGDALAFCPPLIVNAAEIDTIVNSLALSLDQAAEELAL